MEKQILKPTLEGKGNPRKIKVLVYGATGSQQAPVLDALLLKGYQVRATTHHSSKIPQLLETGAEPIVADMEKYEELLAANKNIDVVSLLIPFFLANPADGFTMAKNAIDAALASRVKLLVWNTSGFIPEAPTGNPALDMRIQVQDYLRKSGLPHIIIQPSVYAENLLGPWTAPFVANDYKVAYPTPAHMPIGWIATKDVAALVVQALESKYLAGSSFKVSGLENITGTALAEKFSAGLGRHITFYSMPPKDFGKILDSLFGEGAGKSAEIEYQKLVDAREFPEMHVPMDRTLQLLPVKVTPVEEWVKENRTYFTKNEKATLLPA